MARPGHGVIGQLHQAADGGSHGRAVAFGKVGAAAERVNDLPYIHLKGVKT
jgi:hypothetical protein